jgi:hypothetical protein
MLVRTFLLECEIKHGMALRSVHMHTSRHFHLNVSERDVREFVVNIFIP